MNEYIHAVLIGLDEALAAVGTIQNDMTISTRCGMAVIDDAIGRPVTEPLAHRILLDGADALDKIEPGHCNNAIRADRDRANAVLAALSPYLGYLNANGPT